MSRYPVPGTITPVWGYDDQESECGVVLATSRHRWRVELAEALRIGREAFGPQVKLGNRDIWRSVTKDCEDFGEAEVGGWASTGDGAAWVEMVPLVDIYPSDAEPLARAVQQ